MDLLALAEHASPPATIKGDLAKFVVRVKKEVADLPSGGSWEAFLKEVAALKAEEIPTTFRTMISEQRERDDRDTEHIDGLVETWSAAEPTAFALGEKAPEIVHAKTARTPRTSRRASPGAGRARSTAVTDEVRVQALSDLCMERLVNASSDTGLKELVLIAGVRHRAKQQYPNVTPNEVTTVLKNLKAAGLVRYSAGRWSSVARW